MPGDRRIASLECELKKINERNMRVEADKAWETSMARRIAIAAGTYAFSALFLFSIDAQSPLLVAFVPTFGFLFSTLTLPVFKKWWLSRRQIK